MTNSGEALRTLKQLVFFSKLVIVLTDSVEFY